MRRQRRESEFTEFYAARRAPLRRTAYLIVRDWHTAEDLTQQSMVKLYAAWPRVRTETVDAFARRIVVNERLSHLRRRRDIPVDRVPDVDLALFPLEDGQVLWRHRRRPSSDDRGTVA